GNPHIVDVTDFGALPSGAAYFVMEYLKGRPLDVIIDAEAPLTLLRTLSIAHQLAGALAAAHAQGIIHRDLKPENVIIESRPGRRDLVRAAGERFEIEREKDYDFVKLLDFGVAKILDAPASSQTAAGMLFGTPEYMAPEAARGVPVDARADIYAL